MSENTEGTALAEKEKKTASPEEMLSQLLEKLLDSWSAPRENEP